MRIPIFYIPKTRFKKFLIIEKRYKCSFEIIPIGCDCHPAYTLQKLNIRKHSLPFDWLNTDPIKGIDFVFQNLKDGFGAFLRNLSRNGEGHIVSEKYPYAEFMHEKNLIENQFDRDKFAKRIKRLQRLLTKKIYFLYNVTSVSLKSDEQVFSFYNSVVEFTKQLKADQFLCLYIRYDESLSENTDQCTMLADLLSNNPKVRMAHYVREISKFGLWGSAERYESLYKSLRIDIKLTFPKMYFK